MAAKHGRQAASRKPKECFAMMHQHGRQTESRKNLWVWCVNMAAKPKALKNQACKRCVNMASLSGKNNPIGKGLVKAWQT